MTNQNTIKEGMEERFEKRFDKYYTKTLKKVYEFQKKEYDPNIAYSFFHKIKKVILKEISKAKQSTAREIKDRFSEKKEISGGLSFREPTKRDEEAESFGYNQAITELSNHLKEKYDL